MAKKEILSSYLLVDGKYLIITRDRSLWKSIKGLEAAKKYVKDNNIILKRELV